MPIQTRWGTVWTSLDPSDSLSNFESTDKANQIKQGDLVLVSFHLRGLGSLDLRKSSNVLLTDHGKPELVVRIVFCDNVVGDFMGDSKKP